MTWLDCHGNIWRACLCVTEGHLPFTDRHAHRSPLCRQTLLQSLHMSTSGHAIYHLVIHLCWRSTSQRDGPCLHTHTHTFTRTCMMFPLLHFCVLYVAACRADGEQKRVFHSGSGVGHVCTFPHFLFLCVMILRKVVGLEVHDVTSSDVRSQTQNKSGIKSHAHVLYFMIIN